MLTKRSNQRTTTDDTLNIENNYGIALTHSNVNIFNSRESESSATISLKRKHLPKLVPQLNGHGTAQINQKKQNIKRCTSVVIIVKPILVVKMIKALIK